ncbi:hypothetical protein FRB95_000689 [Tulasnella sp. JGI-2019a]|nr:hypothetical protein FRB95_000689 [Tulasnella sp. JGI-2019a]
MHPALLLDEVLRCIIDHLEGRMDKLRFALTCHDIMEPALDDIWREVHLDGLKPVLPLFPTDALSEQSDESELTLTRVIEPHEWARFDNITRRIRSIISCDLFDLPDSFANFLHRSLQLRGEQCLFSSTINTIHLLRLNLNSTIQLTLLPILLNPHLKEVELAGWYSIKLRRLPDYAESDMNSAISALSGRHCVKLENLSISFGSVHKQPSWTMDPTALLDVLRQNPSLKTVTLRLSIPAVTVIEELGDLSRLERLEMRWWKDPGDTGTTGDGTTSMELFPSLRNIQSGKLSTFRRILSYMSTHLITWLKITVSSFSETQELFNMIQPCSALKSIHIMPIVPLAPTISDPLDLTLSFQPILKCKAMENFFIHTLNTVPPSDSDLTSLAVAWPKLSTFTWSSLSRYGPQATLEGLKTLSANCRSLRKLDIPIQVPPELPKQTPHAPFCDGVTVDIRQWRVDDAVDIDRFVGYLAPLAPRDGTPWLRLGNVKAGVWIAVGDRLGQCYD